MSDYTNVVDALLDLTRVTIALNGRFKSKSEAMRLLSELNIPPVRIAAILGVQGSDVRSALTKARKKQPSEAQIGIAVDGDGARPDA
jgi:DNA-directed RNA polymerase specialized sigma24 family protein